MTKWLEYLDDEAEDQPIPFQKIKKGQRKKTDEEPPKSKIRREPHVNPLKN